MRLDDEVIRTKLDSHNASNGIPRHDKGRKKGGLPGRAAIWHVAPPAPIVVPIWGKFPIGFLEWVAPQLAAHRNEILHVCSGGLTPADGGLRIDFNRDVQPDIVADGRHLPLASNSIRAVLLDPPYSEEYARELYKCGYPRPSHLLKEAVRVLEPGGRVGIVHFLIPCPAKGSKVIAAVGITAGCGYRIRAVTVYEKKQADLALAPDTGRDAVRYNPPAVRESSLRGESQTEA